VEEKPVKNALVEKVKGRGKKQKTIKTSKSEERSQNTVFFRSKYNPFLIAFFPCFVTLKRGVKAPAREEGRSKESPGKKFFLRVYPAGDPERRGAEKPGRPPELHEQLPPTPAPDRKAEPFFMRI
jgi:hypothetical protein